MKSIVIAIVALAFTATAFAKEGDKAATPPEGGMDMSKMGAPSRKPTNEKATKKEIEAWIKAEDELAKKKDVEGMLARVDFPVFMLTDDSKGVPSAKQYNKEEYVAMMKPFYENMPEGMTTTHKPTISVLSDSLVVVVDEFTMTMGKTKVRGKNSSILVKRDGVWKWKSMTEAGWGDMPAQPAAAAAPTK